METLGKLQLRFIFAQASGHDKQGPSGEAMEKDTEATPSRKSGELGGPLLKGLHPLPIGQIPFKLPQPEDEDEDDDGIDSISLKEWQPEEKKTPFIDAEGTSYSDWQPVKAKESLSNGSNGTGHKGSVRTRFTPLVEANGEVSLPPSIHGGTPAMLSPLLPPLEAEDELGEDEEDSNQYQHDEYHENGYEGGHYANGSYDSINYENSYEDALEDALEAELMQLATESKVTEHQPKGAHHQHSISLANGIAPPPAQPAGGVAFGITQDDDGRPRHSTGTAGTGSSRGSSLRVSFIDEREIQSPSPPRSTNRSPLRSRQPSKSPAKSRPGWESSTKIGTPAPPPPKKFVRPTLHGIKVKKGEGGVAKTAMRASMSALETEIANKSAHDGRSGQLVARSWDPHQYCGGGEYDAASQLISRSLVGPTEITGEEPGLTKPGRPFLPRNGTRKPDDNGTENGAEGLKPAVPGAGGVPKTNKSAGDFGRLFSKLRRSSAPLAKPPSQPQPAVIPRASSVPAAMILRANSVPSTNVKTTNKNNSLAAKNNSLDLNVGNQKYTIGSYASLKLLQECAQTEKMTPTSAYNVHKPRKIRDHEPHRHYYKTISKTLDQKLK